MAANTKIEWTDATWPVVAGCTKVSAGCDNCYAIRDSRRLGENPNPKVSGAYNGTAAMKNGRVNWTGLVRPLTERLDWPLKWKKPRRIFVCNESDLFHEAVPDSFIAEVFNIMASGTLSCTKRHKHEEDYCWQGDPHIFQVLTKRPARALDFMTRGVCAVTQDWPGDAPLESALEGGPPFWPLPNVWFGVSVEDQKTADERITLLLQTPAAVRFVSYEPALGSLRYLPKIHPSPCSPDVCCTCKPRATSIDWLIAGGESGPGARPAHPDWIRSVRDQCVAAVVPFFFKQWGEWLPEDQMPEDHPGMFQDYQETGPNVRLVEYERGPAVAFPSIPMFRVGKKAAGRVLDGRQWHEFPKC